MKVRNVLVGLFGAALVGGITTLPAAEDPAATSPPGSDNLRWTPHRVASMPRDPAPNQVAPAPPAATREAPAPKTSVASTAAPTTPPGPASVSLPPGVPPIGGSATPGYAPLRQSFPTRLGDWMSLNRLSGNMQTSSPADGGGMLGIDFTRAPQGERGRPILAPEAMQRRGMPRTAVAMGPAYDGGIAPPFNPGIQPGIQAARPGRERIAMNVDGIPSVMARGPQAAAGGWA
ncbi:MAG: hypothetical protein EBR28_10380, partial [Planctomycetia bacterium]|nr:hypothetical protein [Planctomycetia bacterium]